MRLTPASRSLRFVSGNWFICVRFNIQTSWYVIQNAQTVNRLFEFLLGNNSPSLVHSFHSSARLRSGGDFFAIGERRLWRNDDNVAVIQPLLYLNSSFCLLAADDANALNDSFSDCPHIGFAFLTSDGTFWNCDTQLLRRRWLLFQEAHLDTHFGFNNLQVRLVELNLHFYCAFLPIRLGIEFDQRRLKAAVSLSIRHSQCG